MMGFFLLQIFARFGSEKNDICGRSWVHQGSEHGDPILFAYLTILKTPQLPSGPNLVVYRLPRKLRLSLLLHKRFYVQLRAHRLQLHKPFYVQLRAHRLHQSGFVQEPGGMVGKTAAIKTYSTCDDVDT
ncbi:hypothetical protein C5167_013713 [Papaver somniferum]|uniref:Uncharacterized protein n=1 Tax=Papaver somniferum TaxID=3469 RepID=A0A4Y7J235_PAPSO|nr:hypothetical protein C5167_013713 [Papaver somniferum]